MKSIVLSVFVTLTALNAFSQIAAETSPGINLEAIVYPFPVQYFALDIQGEKLQMAYMDVQSAQSNGQTVLLLHGKNFNGAYWEETAKALSADGYRVIIPDQIGFGKSSKPAQVQYTFQLLASNTKKILEELNIQRLTVLGHSMGGMLAMRFTLMYPEMVEKLVLENPLGLEDYKLKVPYQSVDQWYADEMAQTYEKIKAYQRVSYYGGQWKPEYDKWLQMTAGWTTDPNYPRLAWNAARTYDMIFTQPVCYEFQQVKVPVLLIIGQRDRTAIGKNKVPADVQATLGDYPALGKMARQQFPNAQLAEIKNIGHLPHIEAFDQFIQPLRAFLKQ
jgi:pimeloyl-ACP methyl ester carboxylesterase